MEIEKIKEIINGLTEVPSLAVVKFKLLRTLNDEKATLGAIAELVKYDHAIIVKIISVVNSAQFGFRGKIKSIEQAIFLLGVDAVRNITLGVSIFSILLKGQNELKKIWAHSYLTASIAERICGEMGTGTETGLAFLAGLLHDVGRPILLKVMGEEIQKEYLNNIIYARGSECLKSEKRAFGCTHPEAGAWFLENLSFPEEIVQSVLHHHYLGESKRLPDPISVTSYLAEGMLSAKRSANIPFDGEWTLTHSRILRESGLSMGILEDIGQYIKNNESEMCQFFELV